LLSPAARHRLAVSLGSDATEKEWIALYEVPSGNLLRTFEAGPTAAPGKAAKGVLGGGPGGIAGIAGFRGAFSQKLLFSPDGKTLAFQPAPGATIVLLDTATGTRVGSLRPAEGSTAALQGAFSPDGRCLALQMSDGPVTLYELATGQPRRTYGSKLPPTVKPRRGFQDDLLMDMLGSSVITE